MGIYNIYPLLAETTYSGLEIVLRNDYYSGYLTGYLLIIDNSSFRYFRAFAR